MNFDAAGKPVLASKPTEHVCDKCGKPMILRDGPRGPFLACTGYPKCRAAKDVDAEGNPLKPIDTGVVCEKCGSPMTVKRGPRGPFLGLQLIQNAARFQTGARRPEGEDSNADAAAGQERNAGGRDRRHLPTVWRSDEAPRQPAGPVFGLLQVPQVQRHQGSAARGDGEDRQFLIGVRGIVIQQWRASRRQPDVSPSNECERN